jgi:hypothetical protein
MSSSGGRKPAIPGGEEAEVEALLRAAQDAVMLKLQANSHLVSSTSASASAPTPPSVDTADPLDSDLARRFEALKSRAPKPDRAGSGGMEELSARFAALKGAAGPEKETRVKLEDLGGESSEDEEEEVDKLMRWATDAARLDVATAGVGAGEKARCAKVGNEADEDEKSSVSGEDDEEEEEERLEMEMARKRRRWRRASPRTSGSSSNDPTGVNSI